jgi:hypothetical protein
MKIFKKKKTAAAVVSAVAAASVLVSAAFTAPEDVFTDPDSNQPTAIVEVSDAADDDAGLTDSEEDETKKGKRSLRSSIASVLRELPTPIKILILLPMWLIGEGITLLVSALLSTAGRPVLLGLASLALNLLVLFCVTACGLKLLFPNKRLKELFTKQRIIWMIVFALILTVADIIMPMVFDTYNTWSLIVKTVLAAAATLVLILRRNRKRQTVSS